MDVILRYSLINPYHPALLPADHPYGGEKAWLMIDEVRVE